MRPTPSDHPLVSVVIPAFNAADTIATTIESLLRQTYPSIEIVVVNDGSTDGTEEVLAGFGDGVRVVTQANQGIAVARGIGMSEARGAYIAWLDSDDCCDPNSVAYRVAVLEARPDVALVSTAFESFDAVSSRPDIALDTYYNNIRKRPQGLAGLYPEEASLLVEGKSVPFQVGNLYLPLFEGNVIHPPTAMFRRESFERCGSPDPGYFTPEPDYFIQIARTGLCAVIPLPLMRYRLSPGQISSLPNQTRLLADSLRCIDTVVAADPDLLKTHPEMIRRRQGEVYANMFGALAESDKKQALGFLAKALRHGRLPSLSGVTRFFLPPSWTAQIRMIKARQRQAVNH